MLLALAIAACGGHGDGHPKISPWMRLSDGERTSRCLAMTMDERVALFFASRRRHHTFYGLDACFIRASPHLLRRLRGEIARSGSVYEANDLAVLASEARRDGFMTMEEVAALDLWGLCRARGEEGPWRQPGACFEAARRAVQ